MNVTPTHTPAPTLLGAIGVDYYFFSIVLTACYLILGFYYVAHCQCFPLIDYSIIIIIIKNTTTASFFIFHLSG
jgi:hypothetical protein